MKKYLCFILKKFNLTCFILVCIILVSGFMDISLSQGNQCGKHVCDGDTGFFQTGVGNNATQTIPMEWTRKPGIDWREIEISEGVFDWTDLDEYVQDVESENLKVVFVIRIGNKTGSWPLLEQCNQKSCPLLRNPAYHSQARQAWKNFMKEFFDHFKDKDFIYYQIGNEYANAATYWGGTVDEYIELLQLADEARDEVNPDAIIILGGLIKSQEMYQCYHGSCGFPNIFDFQNTLLQKQNSAYYDVIDPHLFNFFKYNPTRIEDSIEWLEETMSDQGYSKHIASLEWTSVMGNFDHPNRNQWTDDVVAPLNGCCGAFNVQTNTCSNPCDEDDQAFLDAQHYFEQEQAKDFIKMFVVMKEQKLSPIIYVRGMDYTNWDNIWWHFQGVIRRDINTKDIIAEKPTSYNYKKLVKIFGTEPTVEKIDINERLYKVISDGEITFVAWDDSGNSQIDLSPYVSTNNVQITHIVTELNGNNDPIYPDGEIVPANAVPVSETPIFVEAIQTVIKTNTPPVAIINIVDCSTNSSTDCISVSSPLTIN